MAYSVKKKPSPEQYATRIFKEYEMGICKEVRIPEDVCIYILRMHGEFTKPETILKGLKEKYGQSANYFTSSITRLNKLISEPESRILIANFRAQYINRIKDVGISHKRCRLEDLEEARQILLEKMRNLKDGELREFVSVIKELNTVLSNAREEIEGKSMTFNQFNVIGDFNEKTDEDLANRRDELIKQAERSLIGRTPRINDNSEGIEEATVR